MANQLDHDSPAEFIAQWLAENSFQTVGYVGSFPSLPMSQFNPVHIIDCNQYKPWDNTTAQDNPQDPSSLEAVVIADCFTDYSKQDMVQLLAGYRNALVAAILVFVGLEQLNEWQSADFYGLGFKKIAAFPHPEHPLQAFEYNLRSYNHKRLWNTPEYWANPENFGKYWW